MCGHGRRPMQSIDCARNVSLLRFHVCQPVSPSGSCCTVCDGFCSTSVFQDRFLRERMQRCPAGQVPRFREGLGPRLSWTCIPRTDTERLRQNQTLDLQLQPAAFGLLSTASGLSLNRIRTSHDGLVKQCLECVSSRTGSDQGDKAKGI